MEKFLEQAEWTEPSANESSKRRTYQSHAPNNVGPYIQTSGFQGKSDPKKQLLDLLLAATAVFDAKEMSEEKAGFNDWLMAVANATAEAQPALVAQHDHVAWLDLLLLDRLEALGLRVEHARGAAEGAPLVAG